MADRDGTAVDVHNCRIPTHFFVHGAGLCSKGFVGFDQIKVFGLPARFFQCLARGIDRADAHDRRVNTSGGVRCDARKWLDAALFGFIRAHQQGTSGTVVQARRVGGGDRAAFCEGRTHFLHRFNVCTMADVFVLVDRDVALAGFHGIGGDLICEFSSLLGCFGLVLRGDSKLVLLFATDLPFFCYVFSGLTHVVAVECIPQPVADHRVDELQIAHFLARTQVLRMGRQGHVFLTTSGNNVCVAQLDVLGTQCHGAQAGATDLVDAPRGGFLGVASVDVGLTGRVLALCSGQHLSEDCFADLCGVDTGAGNDFFQNCGTQIMGGRGGERATKVAHGSAGGGCDDDVGHEL